MKKVESKIDRKYGWMPGLPNKNLKAFAPRLTPESGLPKLVDFRDQLPKCYDQGRLGSCTANMGAAAIEHLILKEKYQFGDFTPSRLFIYYNTRKLEGTTGTDSGATISDTITSINEFGVCPESRADGTTNDWFWTYDDNPDDKIPFISQAKFKEQPPEQCYKDAVLHRGLQSEGASLDRLTVLNILAMERPINYGFTVYQSFEDSNTIKTGLMELPGANEGVLGGHAQLMAGYILDCELGTQGVKDWVIIHNSWGQGIYTDNPRFGNMEGCYLAPLDGIICNPNMASDAHVLDLVGFKQQ